MLSTEDRSVNLRRIGACVFGLPGLVLLTMTCAMAIETLDDYRWDSRLLLVFAPTEDDERYRRTKALVESERCEVENRDLVVGWFPLSGPLRLGGKDFDHGEAVRLRGTLGLGDDAFAVLLIGKDGGEKHRTAEIPDLADIFALIDGMPMRRAEMAAGKRNCADG